MPKDIRISLFGRFSVRASGEPILDHAPRKAQELLAYLLLHHGRSHPREALGDLLWGECESPHARRYLRQALWQLHAGLLALGRARASRLIQQDAEWVELDLDDCASVDTLAFETVFRSVQGRRVSDPAQAQSLVEAVQLYRGPLLEGWAQPWCTYERDRFREMYLSLLDKLSDYFEQRGEYQAAIAYGTAALQCDRARERTHRHLMALHFRNGDRTGALRQYERCVLALREELEIGPGAETEELRCVLLGRTVGNGSHRRTDRPRVRLAEVGPASPSLVRQ